MEEKRTAINGYIRKKRLTALPVQQLEVTILKKILYNPQDELKTLQTSKYVTVANVTAASGKYPVRKRQGTTLASVDY